MKGNSKIHHDAVFVFGDRSDGVIGVPGLTDDGHVVEASCFFGDSRPKGVVVISSQIGCPFRCSFCEFGGVRYIRHLSAREMAAQAAVIAHEAKLRGLDIFERPYKVTVANGGEPLFNPELTDALSFMSGPLVSFKVSSILPVTSAANNNLVKLAYFARRHPNSVQLQVSLISTDESVRKRIAGGRVASFMQVREAGEMWQRMNPGGRRVNLSLIITKGMPCDAKTVVDVLTPDLFRFRFREYVPTVQGRSGGHEITSDDRLRAIKDDFAAFGYEVTDWASPSPIERRFNLAANVIRRMYLDMLGS